MEIKRQHPYTIIHLHPNDQVIDSLKTICKRYSIQTAVILSGIGQLKDITLGYFKEKNNYTPEHFSQPHELLSLSGTLIYQDDEIHPHLHAIISTENKQTFGGHLISASVEITNEIIMLDLPVKVSRKQSNETGLMEMNLSI
jgi:uncharacterized protein